MEPSSTASVFSARLWSGTTGSSSACAMSSYVIFHPHHASSNTAREFLSQISGIQISTDATDLEKLTLFLEAARKLNTTGVLDEILVTLLDATLKLTRAERGYVFMRDEEGNLRARGGAQFQGRATAG